MRDVNVSGLVLVNRNLIHPSEAIGSLLEHPQSRLSKSYRNQIMGGSAFPALTVCRLSPAQYEELRNRCSEIVQDYFHDVTYPTPAPEKVDHGDVDIYVHRMKREELDLEALMHAISATHRISHGRSHSFAVPLSDHEGEHAQVDIHICKDGYLEWELFMSSFGDLTQILRLLSRGLGITMNDKGINVRVPQLELSNRAMSMILLTKEPSEAMEFLGLDKWKWLQGFETEDEVFAWCSAGRYFSNTAQRPEKTKDRVHMAKRPMYARYVRKWLSEPGDSNEADAGLRQQVLQDAIARFDVRDQYEALILYHKKTVWHQKVVEALQEHIPAGKAGQRQIMRGIKRWVSFHDGTFLLEQEEQTRDVDNAPQTPDWFGSLTDQDFASFVDWLKINQSTIREMEARFGGRNGNAKE